MAKRGMAFAVTTGGLLLAGAGIASADATATTSGAGGVLSGNAVQLPAILGLNACGNQAGVLAASGSAATTSCSIAESAPTATAMTSGAGGVLSGNTAQLPIDVPVNLCGNSVLAAAAEVTAATTNCAAGPASSSTSTSAMTSSGAAASGGTAASSGTIGAGTSSGSGSTSSSSSGSSSGSTATADTTGMGGVLSGNVIQLPIDVPVNLCGNLVSILGVVDSIAPVSCTEGAPAPMPSMSSSPSPAPSASSSSSPSPSTTPSSASLSTSQISQGSNAPGQIGAIQPLAPAQPIADPVVFWPRPGSAQHVNMPQHAIPAKVTCDVVPSAHTEAMGAGPGGALGTVGATAAAFASGTGLRVLGRRRRRRH